MKLAQQRETEEQKPSPILIVFSGVIASGKSTAAFALKQQRQTAWLIARDQFRESVFGGADMFSTEEEVISQAMLTLARMALALRCDVIIDDLNVFAKERQRWNALAEEMHVKIEWHVIDTPVEECIRRDSGRQGSVGRAVIEEYAAAAGMILRDGMVATDDKRDLHRG